MLCNNQNSEAMQSQIYFSKEVIICDWELIYILKRCIMQKVKQCSIADIFRIWDKQSKAEKVKVWSDA